MSKLVDGSLGKPIHGVSQQAESLRGRGQCSDQINFLPDPVDGLRRRPHSDLQEILDQYDIYADFTDSEGEKFLAVQEDPQLVDIFDAVTATKTSVTITDSTAFDYVVDSLASVEKLSVAFSEDSLYIANPNVTCEEDTGITPPTRFTDIGIIYCLGGQYSREYRVEVTFDDGTTANASFTTPDGTSAGDIDEIKSTFIITELYNDLNPNAKLTADTKDDHLLLSEATSTKITSITCSDDEGGVALKCIFKATKAITDLPTYAPEGAVVTISGESGSDDDSYFEFGLLETSVNSGLDTFGEAGVWFETVAVGAEFEFDLTTMPVRIEYETGGGFSLELVAWRGREIGDEESSETPSLVGNTVKDLTTIQSRLGLLSDRSVLFSRTKRPTELWRRSIVGGVQVDDAIDGSGDASTGVHTHFAKVAQDLAVFTKLGQYVILGSQALTPDNVKLSLTTRNTSIPEVPPIGVSGNIYFPTDNGEFMGLSEYYKDDLNYFSLPVTKHVPRYIKGRATMLKGSNPQSMLAMATDDDASILYCYKFLFDGTKRLQSAWFKMQFNDPIIHYFFTSNTLVVITQGIDEHILEVIEFDSVDTGNIDFEILLDRRKEYTVDMDGNITPDVIHYETGALFVSTESGYAGLPIDFEDNLDGTYKVFNSNEGEKVVGGFTFRSSYVPSAPRLFDKNNEVVQTGELNVRNLAVNVEGSGTFEWKIETDYGHTFEGEFSNRIWGAGNNLIGSEPMLTRQWNVPWRGKSTNRTCEISTNGYTPLNISYIEFTGDLRKQKRRI